jgi:hypothetical protein
MLQIPAVKQGMSGGYWALLGNSGRFWAILGASGQLWALLGASGQITLKKEIPNGK